ncbi:She3p NDAI_0A08140 [Naumovozyma dairenensis CBS 421]|uniref:SWI5-dependent HO expression protein 3 n=1 Tax=Naumovozyma dairenensis (strain ATCC 10597 / BCRC 20456 / CBS 421 / NBRC 0211 / NRRL Y-12639) TaxID=1071378 RepID=G0W580_NAUDC|nr:hypothetical protein NDAI_0A08140 [Naumovozyma dairenensis CBS 421]CCD22968.1 hypothetical protein NDAI_0A08140 [Naumovozyma dairenensis CBS 421]
MNLVGQDTTTTTTNNNNNNTEKLGSPSKLAPHHGLFMTNLEYSPSSRSTLLGHNTSPSASSFSPPSSSATFGVNRSISMNNININNKNNPMMVKDESDRVIETLREQVDTLTASNLQLSLQSENLLKKLENANEFENSLINDINSMRLNNENLNAQFENVNAGLKEKESKLNELKNSLRTELDNEKVLNRKIDSFEEKQRKLMNTLKRVRCQYESLMESQSFYKEHYSMELLNLQNVLQDLKINDIEIVDLIDSCNIDGDTADGRSNSNEEMIKKIEADLIDIEKSDTDYLESFKIQTKEILSDIDLPHWSNLYQESKIRLLQYKEEMKKMETTLESRLGDTTTTTTTTTTKDDEKKTAARNESLKKLESGQDDSKTSHDTTIPQENEDTTSQLKMRKLRKNSANSSNSSSVNSRKRNSFYGASSPILTPNASSSRIPSSSSSSSSLSPALPGVMRKPSLRKPSPHTNSNNSNSNHTASNGPRR